MSRLSKISFKEHQLFSSKSIFANHLHDFVLFFLLLCFACYGAGCSQASDSDNKAHPKSGPDTGEAIAVTLFTKKTELFMEYSPLVANQKAAFLAHLTILGKAYQPVREGRLLLDFVQGGRTVLTLVAKKALREGIFKPQGKVPSAGTYTLRLRLEAKKVRDVILVSKAVIYPTVAAAKKANPKQPEDPQELSFLKEQQWKIPFAMMLVKRRMLRDGLRLSGRGQAMPSSHVRLTAPLSGMVSGIVPNIQEGHQLKKGQRILFVEPMLFAGTSLPQINQRIRAAQGSLRLSQFQLKRLSKMVKARALGSWRISQIKHQISLHKAQVQAAKSSRRLFYRSRRRGSGRSHAVVVRAPFQGVVLKQFVSKGAFVTQGKPLLEIASLREMRLIAHLPEFYSSQAHKIQSATYRLGLGKERPLPKPYAIGASIHPITRTLPLFFRIKNPGFLKHNQRLEFKVNLSTREAIAVPAQAVVDDQGTPVVFVQAGGEAFLKRNVTTGIRDRNWVEIRSGIRAGERIVSLGAYELLLSLALKKSGMDSGHAH